MDIPDPLPLRTIEIPAEVDAVDGCDCGGLRYHFVGCSLFLLPPEQAKAFVEAAEDRVSEFTAALNRRLRESGFLRRYGHRVTDYTKVPDSASPGRPGDRLHADLGGGPLDGRSCIVKAAYWLSGRPAIPDWLVFPGKPPLVYELIRLFPGNPPRYAYKGFDEQGCVEIAVSPELLGDSEKPEVIAPLDPALLPCLDWPLWLREGGLRCEKGDCPCEDGDIHDPGPVKWILSERTTLRTILEGLKQHAEATS